MTSPHFVPGLSLTTAQIAERRSRLGASEMPVVAGLSKHRSLIELYAEKRGLIAEPFEGNEFTEWGTRLEGVVADAYAEKVGVRVVRIETLVAIGGWRSATPDRKVIDPKSLDGFAPEDLPWDDADKRIPWLRGLEVKCRGDYSASDFGEPGTDQVPDEVAIQCHTTMSVMRQLETPIIVNEWDIATLIGGNKFRWFRIFYDAQIDADLTEMAHNFWHRHVIAGVEPPVDASAATTKYLQSKFRQNSETIVPATLEQEDVLASLFRVRQQIKDLEGEEQGMKNKFMQWLGTNAGIQGRAGRVTWKAPNGNDVSWKSIAEAMGAPPELIAKYSTPMSRRFLPTPAKAKK